VSVLMRVFMFVAMFMCFTVMMFMVMTAAALAVVFMVVLFMVVFVMMLAGEYLNIRLDRTRGFVHYSESVVGEFSVHFDSSHREIQNS
jgi:hypothetical protein